VCTDFKMLQAKVPIIFFGTPVFSARRDGRYCASYGYLQRSGTTAQNDVAMVWRGGAGVKTQAADGSKGSEHQQSGLRQQSIELPGPIQNPAPRAQLS
jgi:hypothetical protein